MLAHSLSWLTRERLVLAGLLLFTAIVRGGVLWGMQDNLNADPDAYREIAENVLQHGVYGLGESADHDADPFAVTPLRPTAYRPPLYPIVLSNLPTADGKHVSLWKVAMLHVLLGMATVWLTWLTAHRLQASGGREPPEAGDGTPQRALSTAPLVAALLIACDPILLNQQALVMTETLATLLAILSLWCLVRFSGHRYWWNAALAGGAIGLAALCRPTFLPWLGLVGLVVISDFGFRISDWRQWLFRALPNFVALAIAAATVMSPWAIRNQREFGKPMLTTTHGGYTLALGNNESFYEWLQNWSAETPWSSRFFDFDLHLFIALNGQASMPGLRDEDSPSWELWRDTGSYQFAYDAIGKNPKMAALSSLYRLRQLWSPLPHKLTADESTGRMLLRYGTAAWYCGVYLLSAVGVWRLRWRLFRQPWLWGVLLCLAFTAVHTFYWCNLRMRAPLMPFVALVAAAGVAGIRDRANTDETDGAD